MAAFRISYLLWLASLGVDSQEAQRMLANQTILMEHLERRQEAVSGVALDEEMGNLIRFQHAYNAAARLITALDETLSVVIERMGHCREVAILACNQQDAGNQFAI